MLDELELKKNSTLKKCLAIHFKGVTRNRHVGRRHRLFNIFLGHICFEATLKILPDLSADDAILCIINID